MNPHDPILFTAILTLLFCIVYAVWSSLKATAEADEQQHVTRCPHEIRYVRDGKRYCNACDERLESVE